MKALTNKCAHPKCEKQKPRERYACGYHWKILPRSLKEKIWDGYRTGASSWLAADKEAQEWWTRGSSSQAPASGTDTGR